MVERVTTLVCVPVRLSASLTLRSDLPLLYSSAESNQAMTLSRAVLAMGRTRTAAVLANVPAPVPENGAAKTYR